MVPDTFWGLFLGYTVIWGLIVVYLVTLGRRITRIEKQLEEGSEGEQ